jgi:hypothetical protein
MLPHSTSVVRRYRSYLWVSGELHFYLKQLDNTHVLLFLFSIIVSTINVVQVEDKNKKVTLFLGTLQKQAYMQFSISFRNAATTLSLCTRK